jgi:hypothetical protein
VSGGWLVSFSGQSGAEIVRVYVSDRTVDNPLRPERAVTLAREQLPYDSSQLSFTAARVHHEVPR